MPKVEISGMAIGVEQKRKLARRATELVIEIYQVPASLVTVVIRENLPENVAVAGVLLADHMPS